MTCQQCGAPCQGSHCQFHTREQSRDGDWQDRLADAGNQLPEEDPLAFLGEDLHYCDPCERPFGSLYALVNHECVIQSPDDARLESVDAGLGRTTRGPTPSAQQRWDAEHVNHGGDLQ